jgi:thiol-disulfide isomerase/thioredoxin
MLSGRKRRWLRLGIELAVIVALVLGVRAYMQRDVAQGLSPPIDAVLLGGEPISLADLRGEPVLVHFWASWCRICRLEEASIAAIARDHQVVTVAMQSGGADAVQHYLDERGVDIPVVVDEFGVLAQRWGVRAVPTSFILDREGAIRHVEVGFTTETGLRARLWLGGR